MAAVKTKAALNFERLEISMRFQPLPPHFRPGPTWIWHCRHWSTFPDVGRLPNSKWLPRKPEVENNYWPLWAGDTLSTATPTFTTTLDTFLTLPTLPDVGWLPKFNMAATKPEVEITFERWETEPRFQLLPPYFRPWPTGIWLYRLCPTSADYRNSRWLSPKPEVVATILNSGN